LFFVTNRPLDTKSQTGHLKMFEAVLMVLLAVAVGLAVLLGVNVVRLQKENRRLIKSVDKVTAEKFAVEQKLKIQSHVLLGETKI